ncbi:MAG: cation transporter [Candidatus Delongbacteria bacterium]|nr:cation transporter [Candidatus Delongbacteria bacterium]
MNNELIQKEISGITKSGMLINLILGILKITTGMIGNSYSAIADGVHSLSDLVTDIAIIIGVKFWSAPPDKDHPYGHGRIETIVTLFVGIMLAAAGIGIGYEAVATIRDPHTVKPGLIALTGIILTIIFKEILFRKTLTIGKKTGSQSVIANAWHHRSDAFSSVLALGSVLTAVLLPGMEFVDHIGGLLVSILIIKVSFDIVKPAFKELCDAGASQKDIELMKNIVSQVEGVRDVHGLRSRQHNSGNYLDLHVLVDDDITVKKGHDIAEKVKDILIEKGPSVVDVVVHIEPFKSHKETHEI